MIRLKSFSKSKTMYMLLVLLLVVFITGFVFYTEFFSPTSTKKSVNFPQVNETWTTLGTINRRTPDHTLCVLVPFRNVYEELFEFIPHISKFLNRQSIAYHIVVVNQVQDEYRFNRGAVFNAGFKIILKQFPDCDYVAFHDIDLLPLNDEIPYTYPGDYFYHVASASYHPLGYIYDIISPGYIGGISIIPNELFLRTNGFSNNFWGWGFESSNFLLRLMKNSIQIKRPTKLSTDRSNTFKRIHSSSRNRDYPNCVGQARNAFIMPDLTTGINDVKYEVSYERFLSIETFTFSIFGIRVPCDYTVTPWCKAYCLEDTNNGSKNKTK